VRITVHHDDGAIETFEDVTEAYLAVRQQTPVATRAGELAVVPDTRSYSWGGNLRELVKEITQSLDELQDILREQRNARSIERNRSVAGNGSKHPGRLVP
jgi:DNA polymerase II small subunit/DNA polymerase delta subunit B